MQAHCAIGIGATQPGDGFISLGTSGVLFVVNDRFPTHMGGTMNSTAVAEVALCYTSDLLDPDETVYTLDYYLDLAQQCVDAGAHILAIKDMAGLLKPAAATALVKALKDAVN